MKKKRRVEFQIEHSEISIFAGPGAPTAGRSSSPIPNPGSLLAVTPETCPTCGSASMQRLTDSFKALGPELSTLQQRINDGTVHLHLSPAGEWWICTESLQGS